MSVCPLVSQRKKGSSRDEKEAWECQQSLLRLVGSEGSAVQTVFLPSPPTPAVTDCMCASVKSFKSNTNTASHQTPLLGAALRSSKYLLPISQDTESESRVNVFY